MVSIDTFNMAVGETIMNCQRIEHDVKMIFAGMLKGDFYANFDYIKKEALGTVLIELEELDNSDGKPFISPTDYKLLKEIKNIRNWLAHSAYTDFMYDTAEGRERNFAKACNKLADFHKRTKQLCDQVEKLRLTILHRYGRI